MKETGDNTPTPTPLTPNKEYKYLQQCHTISSHRFSDFLLTVIRDALNKFRGLKLVLMSATVDVQLFLLVLGFRTAWLYKL